MSISDKSLEKAAVVIAILEDPGADESPCFLLTKRTSKLRKHAGQFALPGGKVDPGENAKQAALRELEEELGIRLSHNDILGVLDDYPTRSGFCITPVVAWVGQIESITPNPNEVAKVFKIPLNDLDKDNLINLNPGEHQDRPVLSINLPIIGHEVYAPTAAIIYQFYEIAIRQQATRVAFYDEPVFAWE